MKKVGVFVVLTAVPYGLQPYPRSLLARSNRSGRIEEHAVPWSGVTEASSHIQIIPTGKGVPGVPSVNAIVKDSRCAFCPVQEPRLDALVDGRIVGHPFGSVAGPCVARRVARQVSGAIPRERGP